MLAVVLTGAELELTWIRVRTDEVSGVTVTSLTTACFTDLGQGRISVHFSPDRPSSHQCISVVEETSQSRALLLKVELEA